MTMHFPLLSEFDDFINFLGDPEKEIYLLCQLEYLLYSKINYF